MQLYENTIFQKLVVLHMIYDDDDSFSNTKYWILTREFLLRYFFLKLVLLCCKNFCLFLTRDEQNPQTSHHWSEQWFRTWAKSVLDYSKTAAGLKSFRSMIHPKLGFRRPNKGSKNFYRGPRKWKKLIFSKNLEF